VKPFKIALCQNIPTFDKEYSVQHAVSMVEQAAGQGASLVTLPEMFYSPMELKHIKKITGDEERLHAMFSELSRKLGIFLCCGSMAYRENGRLYNRSFLFDPQGLELLSYSKCHLYDANFGKFQVKESAVFEAGESISTVETSLGRIGIIICYDIRFPELLRHDSVIGADLILVPSVFNSVTGPAHWHVMMRARAIENQFFLAAVSQGKNRDSFYRSYGHSMVVSPWGDILNEADDTEQIIYADLDPELISEVRSKLPLLQHRRKNIYN
jgi:omega-amidase